MPHCSPPGHYDWQSRGGRAGGRGEDGEGGVRREASVNKKPYPAFNGSQQGLRFILSNQVGNL